MKYFELYEFKKGTHPAHDYHNRTESYRMDCLGQEGSNQDIHKSIGQRIGYTCCLNS